MRPFGDRPFPNDYWIFYWDDWGKQCLTSPSFAEKTWSMTIMSWWTGMEFKDCTTAALGLIMMNVTYTLVPQRTVLYGSRRISSFCQNRHSHCHSQGGACSANQCYRNLGVPWDMKLVLNKKWLWQIPSRRSSNKNLFSAHNLEKWEFSRPFKSWSKVSIITTGIFTKAHCMNCTLSPA